MILYPAIDLKDGQCVRLLRGEMSAATVFGDDPAAQAAKFEAAGCEWLHLVDLNGAFAGGPVNGAAVEAILRRIKVPAQLGGGIRDMATIEMRVPSAWRPRGVSTCTVPSAIVSRKPLTTVGGVFSSCDTLATKSRRITSSFSACVTSRASSSFSSWP